MKTFPKALIGILFGCVITLLLIAFTIPSYQIKDNITDPLQKLNTAYVSIDGSPYSYVNLPHSINNLRPRTKVIEKITTYASSGDRLYIKDVYSPMEVYLDGRLVFSYGYNKTIDPEYYPDPPGMSTMLEFSNYGEATTIQIEYETPSIRKTFTMYSLVKGNVFSLLVWMFHQKGVRFILSLFIIMIGVILMLFNLFSRLSGMKMHIFFWFGLFSFLSGIWSITNNELTIILLPYPYILHTINFVSFDLGAIPLSVFLIQIVAWENRKPLLFYSYFCGLMFIVFMGLHYFKVMNLIQSVIVFQILLLLAILLSSLLVIYEGYIRKNDSVRKFVVPIVVIGIFSFIEFINYYFRSANDIGSAFEYGLFLFVVFNGFPITQFIKEGDRLAKHQQHLQYSLSLMQKQMEEQNKINSLMKEHNDIISRQKHDLRHHLSVIKELSKDSQIVTNYIDTLIQSIPVNIVHYCENQTVNALLSYHADKCKNRGITLDIRIEIPERMPHIKDNEISVILGNLIENAVEACDRMEEKSEKRIELNGKILGEMLVITMKNSYNGIVQSDTNGFFSSKRDSYGIGLTSIQNVAREHYGDANFHYDRSYFYSKIYLRI